MHEEQLQEENEEFAELEKKLGLDYPVNEILKAQQNSKLDAYTHLHKDVEKRNKNIVAINQELKAKLALTKKKQDESTLKLADFRGKCDGQINKLENLYNELQLQLDHVQTEITKTVQNGT